MHLVNLIMAQMMLMLEPCWGLNPWHSRRSYFSLVVLAARMLNRVVIANDDAFSHILQRIQVSLRVPLKNQIGSLHGKCRYP